MIKLIVSDIDGTLIGQQGKISLRNVEAINYALSKGVHFAIASGRAYQDIVSLIQPNHLSCEIIAINGGQYYDIKGNLLVDINLDRERCIEICQLFYQHQLYFMVYTSKGVVTLFDVEQTRRQFVYHKISRTNLNYDEVYDDFMSSYTPFSTLKQVTDLKQFIQEANVYKIEGFDVDLNKIESMKVILKDIEGITYLSSFNNNVEVTDQEAKKGTMLLKVIEKMKITPEEVAVIGDGLNDLSMFECFENSVAVANAKPEILSLAKYVVADVENDGVAKAIYQLIS